MRKLVRKMTGVEAPALLRGAVTVKGPEFPDVRIENTVFLKVDAAAAEGAEVLLEMEVDGETHPALIRRKYGKGMVYYFLFNPLLQQWWGDTPNAMSRTSSPFMKFLLTQLGIPHDTKFGNRGVDLATGRINLHERPIHYAVFRGLTGSGPGRMSTAKMRRATVAGCLRTTSSRSAGGDSKSAAGKWNCRASRHSPRAYVPTN